MKSRISKESLTVWKVTSYAEVWIEIGEVKMIPVAWLVTSYAEVWIEIYDSTVQLNVGGCHLLRGGVD